MKGTSDENEGVYILEREIEVVSTNESSPVVNSENRGRYTQSRYNTPTFQSQCICEIE